MHSMRTPFTTVSGYAQLIEMEDPTSTGKGAEKIKKGCDQIVHSITKLTSEILQESEQAA